MNSSNKDPKICSVETRDATILSIKEQTNKEQFKKKPIDNGIKTHSTCSFCLKTYLWIGYIKIPI